MNWLALVRVLVEFFGPFLQRLLDDLLNRAIDDMDGPPLVTPVAIRQLFAAARARTWFWQRGRLRALALCERIALKRATEIARAMAGTGPRPVLSLNEQVELAEAL